MAPAITARSTRERGKEESLPKRPKSQIRRQHAFSLFCSLIACAGLIFSGQATAQQPLTKLVESHFGQGMRMLKQGNWRAAADEFQIAIKIDPQQAQAHNGLGLALARQGERQQALAEHHRSLEINPPYAEAHYNLGMALGEWGNPQQAMTELAKAVELKPELEPARLALGLLWDDAAELPPVPVE
jgi:Tfp pilus assembly protein PilF